MVKLQILSHFCRKLHECKNTRGWLHMHLPDHIFLHLVDVPTRRDFCTASSFSQHAPRPPLESRHRQTNGFAWNRSTRKRDTPRSSDTVDIELWKGKMTQSAVRIKERLHAYLGLRSPSGRFQVIEASYATGWKSITLREKPQFDSILAKRNMQQKQFNLAQKTKAIHMPIFRPGLKICKSAALNYDATKYIYTHARAKNFHIMI